MYTVMSSLVLTFVVYACGSVPLDIRSFPCYYTLPEDKT